MMYEFFISNYLNTAGTTVVSSEELLYYVPIIEPDRSVTEPIIKCEMGKAGSSEFTLNPMHPFYNRLCQMKTVIRVEYDGNIIFRGRVLTIDSNKIKGTKKVHLEGDLAFLNDSYQEGVEEGDRPKTTIYEYLQNVIKQHNAQMDVEGSE